MPAGWASAGVAVAGGIQSYENNQAAKDTANKNNAQAGAINTGLDTALSTSESINNQPFTAYNAPLVASETPNQAKGTALAAAAPNGPAAGDLNSATSAIDSVNGSTWNPTTESIYANPYTQSVTDASIARENQSYQADQAAAGVKSASSGAYGGSSQAIESAAAAGQHNLNVGQLEATGNAASYDSAMKAWQADNSRKLNVANAYASVGNDVTKMNSQQISDLMTTGGTGQVIAQSNLSSAYNQFLRQQGWSAQQLQPLLATLGKSSSNTPSATGPANNGVNELAGVASTIAGLYGQGYFGNNSSASNWAATGNEMSSGGITQQSNESIANSGGTPSFGTAPSDINFGAGG